MICQLKHFKVVIWVEIRCMYLLTCPSSVASRGTSQLIWSICCCCWFYCLYDSFDFMRYSIYSLAVTAALVTTPVDLVKIQMQAQVRGATMRHSNTFQAFANVYRAGGVRGLWTGCSPNMCRALFASTSQVRTEKCLQSCAISITFSKQFAHQPLVCPNRNTST